MSMRAGNHGRGTARDMAVRGDRVRADSACKRLAGGLTAMAMAGTLFFNAAAVAEAQALPTGSPPGTAQNQEQRTQQYYRQHQLPQKPATPVNPLVVPPHPQASALQHGPSFVLSAVVFNHSAFLTPQELQRVVQPYRGQRVEFADLDALVNKINALYTQRNVVTARAILPPQTIHNGVVHIELIEGRLGKLQIKGNRHTRSSYIERRIALESGTLVDAQALERDLVFFNRTNDVQLRGLLQPGAAAGLTNVLILAREPPRAGWSLFADNNGVDSTGRNEIGATLSYRDLLGITDRLDAYMVKSRGNTDGYVSYSLPVNTHDGRLGLSYSRNQINIINGPYQSLDITGHSWTGGLNFSQPLIATQDWLFSAAGSLSKIHSVTEAAGQGISTSNLDAAAVGFSLQNTTASHIWATTQTLTRLRSTAPTRDYFTFYNGNLTWVQKLGSPYSLLMNFGWQYTHADDLPAAELFQIGGVGSVRGYERGVLSGPRGFYGQFEVHRQFGHKLDAFAFTDYGRVFAAFPKTASVSSVGLGFDWHTRSWMVLSMDLGRPLNTVVPNQDAYRLDARITFSWDAQ